ncbi:lysophospholipid acyltransferase family protein [Phaeovulum vinaykumarii]|uniref:KDO2-lipid IV(A) lauroyltransferase n=1 Tax=Phaeovulum vinaykumarii TaxID=407234 RepID=A0A1N7LG67_9RHOB|nr:lysophospholipid acyltransferase family protein [Phaeovulum vinaykumarii]SIS72784.1 KDO2-lipid IV(A) lauroyltransferase [Phaeovulum vinaykumarii]SOC04511.1 KDO2-lipid IV(A) lauroyltransferase [Phaeovulum vinaykumarii]
MAKTRARVPLIVKEQVEYALVSVALALLSRLPFRWRVPVAGWLMSRIAAPVLGLRRRISENLAFAVPDLPAAERARLLREVPDNLGRMFIELFSPADVKAMVARTPLDGPGLPDLEAAQAAGRPIIVVSGHFGNYDVTRAALIRRGLQMGGLYRPMNNARFNDRYLATIRQIGEPLFPRGHEGFVGMIRHLKAGKSMALLVDQHMGSGARLRFFGKPAFTGLSAASLALRYDALLIPIYAIRQPDGVSFRIEVERPIPPSDEETMMQAVNDSLEAQVRAHMAQWLWTHRRWKRGPASREEAAAAEAGA